MPDGDVRIVSSVLEAGVVMVSSVVVEVASEVVWDAAVEAEAVVTLDTEVGFVSVGLPPQAHRKDARRTKVKEAVILANLRTACLLRNVYARTY